jgi:hypothetical protein
MIDDPFASVWDETSLARQRQLMQRVLAIAERLDVALYLDWGTLLGHVREGRILPWDDDVDFALLDPGRYWELLAAFKSDGLHTWDHRSPATNLAWTKVYDPAYPVTSDHHWTWPFVDIFIYSDNTEIADNSWPNLAFPRDLILPGRITVFEGTRCWEPEQPLAVLDLLYPRWRSIEATSKWNHRVERPNARIFLRPILTDIRGRKTRPD